MENLTSTFKTDPDTGLAVDPNQIGEGQLTEEQEIYKENILDHYQHPHNKRSIQYPSMHHTAMNPLCGDKIEVFLLIQQNGNEHVITDISFQGSGCVISQATMSMLTEQLKNKHTHDALEMTREEIVAMLGIPIGIVRTKCAMLGLRTIQEAIQKKSEDS